MSQFDKPKLRLSNRLEKKVSSLEERLGSGEDHPEFFGLKVFHSKEEAKVLLEAKILFGGPIKEL